MRPTVTYSGSTGIAPQQAVVITTLTSHQQQVVVPGQTLVQPWVKQDAGAGDLEHTHLLRNRS